VAARDGDFDTALVWAGEAVDLIKTVEGAAALVARISAEAETQLRTGAELVRSRLAIPSGAASLDSSYG
jgi:nitronate monooxygenase